MKRVMYMLSFFVLFSCNGYYSAEYNNLKTKNDSLVQVIEVLDSKIFELENTPDKMLFIAQKLISDGSENEGRAVYRKLIDKFPESKEAKVAIEKEKAIISRIVKEEKEKERLKRLGWKALKPSIRHKIGNVDLNFRDLRMKNTWVIDRYSNEYRYYTAEKGNTYIQANLDVISKSKIEILPRISLYKIKGDELVFFADMKYEFYRWKDYGAYLGNYTDKNNLFAYTNKVKFTVGYQANNSIKNEPLVVLAFSDFCNRYLSQKYGNPPIQIKQGDCQEVESLKIEDIGNDVKVVHIFNRSKI